MNLNELNFELRFKNLKTKEIYRALSVNFKKKKISGESLSRKKRKGNFSFKEVRISAFTRVYDITKNKVFENDLVVVTLPKETRIGSVINSKGSWFIFDRKTNTLLSLTDPKILSIKLFKKNKI